MFGRPMSTSAFDVAIDDLLHFVSIKWLADIIIGAESQSFLGRFKRAKTGQHDDGQMRIDLSNLTETFDSAHARHPNVHDNGVGLFFFEKLESSLNAIGGVHL